MGRKKSRSKGKVKGRRSRSRSRSKGRRKSKSKRPHKTNRVLIDHGASSSRVCVLRHGESLLLSKSITDLKIMLYRPIHPPLPPPAEVSAEDSVLSACLRKSTACSSISDSKAGMKNRRDHSSKAAAEKPGAEAPPEEPAPPPESDQPPWFFDTTACLFVDPKNLSKVNYVATGRNTTENKDLSHIPHAVVTGKEPPAGMNYSTYALNTSQGDNTMSDIHLGLIMGLGGGDQAEASMTTSRPPLTIAPLAIPNSPLLMAAADGVKVSLKHVTHCPGLLISCSLFDHMELPPMSNWGVYFMVRSATSSIPICLIPVQVIQERCTSQISIMLRRLTVEHEPMWEIVSMAEALNTTDVPGVLLSMQKRGLDDVDGYNPDYRTDSEMDSGDDESSGSSGYDSSFPDETDDEELDEDDRASKSPVPFEELLAKLPLVAREGRRQYTEGRSNVTSMLDEDNYSGEDEVMDDALKAVVPRFAHGHPVRYTDCTYNCGSKPVSLSEHYSGYRDHYGLEAAEVMAATGVPKLPLLAPRAVPLDRCKTDDEDQYLPPPWDVIHIPSPRSRRSSVRSKKSKKSKKKKKGKRKGSKKGKRSRSGSKKKRSKSAG